MSHAFPLYSFIRGFTSIFKVLIIFLTIYLASLKEEISKLKDILTALRIRLVSCY
jgi:hypothetical protein